METLDLLHQGKIVVKVCKRTEMPKKANFSFVGHLNVLDWAFTEVQVYVSTSKKGVKYYATVKDERSKKEQILENYNN